MNSNKTTYIIEFPMQIVESYYGASNLDITLDDNISYLIGKRFYDKELPFKITKLEFVEAIPNQNDKLVRYFIEVDVQESDFDCFWIRNELEKEGYEKGLTIRNAQFKILYADIYTADILARRAIKNYK